MAYFHARERRNWKLLCIFVLESLCAHADIDLSFNINSAFINIYFIAFQSDLLKLFNQHFSSQYFCHKHPFSSHTLRFIIFAITHKHKIYIKSIFNHQIEVFVIYLQDVNSTSFDPKMLVYSINYLTVMYRQQKSVRKHMSINDVVVAINHQQYSLTTNETIFFHLSSSIV